MNLKFFQLGILGSTGSGKTFLTCQFIRSIEKRFNRIILVDDLMQFRDIKNFIVCETLEKFIQKIINKKEFKLILRFESLIDYENAFKVLWLIKNYLLVIDEISLFCSCYDISESLRNIAQRGRLKNISLIYNTQRAGDINRKLSSQTEFIISFRLQESNDLRYFYINRKKAISINTLKNREYILLRGEIGEFKKRLLESKIMLDFLNI